MRKIAECNRRTSRRVAAVVFCFASTAPCGLILCIGGCQDVQREEAVTANTQHTPSKRPTADPKKDWEIQIDAIVGVYGNIDGAIAMLDDLLSAEPRNVRALTKRGEILTRFRMTRFDEGMVNIDRALSMRPTDSAALGVKARALEARGDHDRALQTLNSAATLNPTDALAFVNRGLFAFRRGNTNEALANASKAIELAPENYRVHQARGDILQGIGQFEEAILDYNTALTLRPDSPSSLWGRSSTWFSLGKFQLALNDLDELDRWYPRSMYSHTARVGVLIQSGDLASARETLLRAIQQNPGDAGSKYEPTTGIKLPVEALKHGESQLNAMLRDRPEMARYIVKGDALWNWAARKFAGDDLNQYVHWEASLPVAAADSCVDVLRGGFLIRIHPLAGDIEDGSERALFEELWARAVYELHNVALAHEFARVEEELLSRGMSKTEYVEAHIGIEQITAQRTRAFYAHVFLPWAIDSGFRETNPSYWQLDAGSPDYVNSWRPGDAYWDSYGVGYDLILAQKAGQAGDYEFARGILEQLRSQDLPLNNSELFTLHYWLAICRLEQGETAKAQESMDKAIEANPSSAVALAGRAYINQDSPEQALVDLNRAIELDPNYAESYRNRAYVRARLGDSDGALADYERALEFDPNDFLTYANRALIRIEREQGDAALNDLNESIRLNPGESELYRLRAQAWLVNQEFDSALADFDEAVRRDRANSLALTSRGEFYLDQRHDPEKALDDLDAAIAAAPEYDFAFATRGRTHEAMGNFEEALADYDQAISLAPRVAGGFYYRAKFLMSCPDANYRNAKRAVEDATRACELTQWEVPEFLSLLADAHAADGNLDAAIEWESKALELATDDEKASHERRLDDFLQQHAMP